MAREVLEKTELDSDESIISLDVRSLYTKVPLKEAVELALGRLYEQVNPPETSRKTMKKLPNLGVSEVHFNCNGLWHVQKDCLAMGASLAVYLANLWLKEYEPALKKEVPKLTVLNEVNKDVCPGCQKKLTYRTKGVECEACLNWYHLGCGKISESEYADIAVTVWYCIACKKQQEADRAENGVKTFLRYADDILRTVKGDPGLVLEAAKKLHPNLQFTIEDFDSNGNLAFLDLYVNVDSGKKITCGWYQKPTHTGTILIFRGWAPLQYRRNVIEGTVHRVFRNTSIWENFDQALEKNRKEWIENQYPKNWSDRVVFETLKTIIEGKKNLEVKASEPRKDKWLKHSPPFLQRNLEATHSKVRQISGAQIKFTTKKLKTCLLSLKTSFARNLNQSGV